MKTVKMLVNTAYKGPVKAGDVISVPDDFAERWVKNSIAEIIEEEKPKENLANKTAKELYALCKEKGIDVEAKQPKEIYLEKLATVED